MPIYPELAGQVAIITGAGRPRGLGAGIARRLAQDGCRLVLHDLGRPGGAGPGAPGEEGLDAVVAEVRALGVKAESYAADLRDEAAIAGLVDFAAERFGRLDILVNNAGVGFLVGPTPQFRAEDWDTVLGVNLRAPFLATKHAAARMIAQIERGEARGGRIINIASQAAKSGVSLMAAYSASKHGLVGLTRSCAVEFGPHQITVNAVCPNHVPTDLGDWQRENISPMRGLDSGAGYWERMRAKAPLGRAGAVEDTANAVAFLASDQARYITGEAMNVSGGEEYH